MTGWPTPPADPEGAPVPSEDASVSSTDEPAPSWGAPAPSGAGPATAGTPFPAENPSGLSTEPPVVTRRLRRMVPRPLEEEPAPTVTRGVLHGSRSTVKPQTRRDRKLVGTLPGWDPLPPGELLVSKPSTTA